MFPETTFAGIAFNTFYGLMLEKDISSAVSNFLTRYTTLSVKNELLKVDGVEQTCRFVIKKDFWGPKEVLLFQKNSDNFDYMLSYSTRNQADYYPMAEFISGNTRMFELQEDNLNHGMFRLKYPSIKHNISDSVVVIKKDHSQLYEITAFIVK